MGKISPKKRQFEIKKKRKRKEKIKKLKEKYFATKNQKEKEKIAQKLKKIVSPGLAEEILSKKET